MKWDAETATAFVRTASEMMDDAKFVVETLPNAEPFAIERAIHRLESISVALCHLIPSECGIPSDKITELVERCLLLLRPLDASKTAPSVCSVVKPPVNHNGSPSRPCYVLDLDWVEALRWNGATWRDIATTLNISRTTLYNHMARDRRPTKRPYTDITPAELDDAVSRIVLSHPFAGSVIVAGHLANQQIKVPLLRIQESLRRVDPIGVMLR